jgi:hypothetical protein
MATIRLPFKSTKLDKAWAIWFLCLIDNHPNEVSAHFLLTHYGQDVLDNYLLFIPHLEHGGYIAWDDFPVVTPKGQLVCSEWKTIVYNIYQL